MGLYTRVMMMSTTGQLLSRSCPRRKVHRMVTQVDRDEYTKNTVFLEIKILSKLHSDNIVRIYDVLET